MASAPIHSVLRCSHSFPSLAKDESPPWSCFDDQVPGRWCEVTGGSSACVCLFVRLYACVCRCDRGKSIPTVMREVPTALPSGIEKTFSSLSSVVPPPPPHTPPTLLIICSFASSPASSVLTFSDDVNTRQPTRASSKPDALDLRNASYTSHWILKLVHRLLAKCSQLAKNIWIEKDRWLEHCAVVARGTLLFTLLHYTFLFTLQIQEKQHRKRY